MIILPFTASYIAHFSLTCSMSINSRLPISPLELEDMDRLHNYISFKQNMYKIHDNKSYMNSPLS